VDRTETRSRERETLDAVARHARVLPGAACDDSVLMRLVGDADFALLGEASHGTDDFYRERAAITRRLIVERGTAAVAVEADWPDALRVNRYVRGLPGDADGRAALGGFRRFPTWMWRNTAVLEFVEWLRGHNAARPPAERSASTASTCTACSTRSTRCSPTRPRDPQRRRAARRRYACFDAYREDAQAYGYATRFALSSSCEDAVVAQLRELLSPVRREASLEARRDDDAASMPRRTRAWCERRALLPNHVRQPGGVVEPARQPHGRDARGLAPPSRTPSRPAAADRRLGAQLASRRRPRHRAGRAGEWNVGQLVRERHGDGAALLGFSTYEGTSPPRATGTGPLETKRVRPGLPGSWEALFHDTALPRFALPMRGERALVDALARPRLQRAIGVIYRPETERQSHYFRPGRPQQFDAIVHLDATSAVEPLDATRAASAAASRPRLPRPGSLARPFALAAAAGRRRRRRRVCDNPG
jgi:erythromycin esterase-like protein